MTRGIVINLWLIPAVPLAGSLIILSLAKSRRTAAATFAIFAQIVALALAVTAFVPTLQTAGFRSVQNFTWFTFGEQTLRIGWVLDPLAAAMLLMIALVGLCIFVFSVGYMADDKNFTRFFAYLSFFSGAMLGVVIANSLLLLFVFWELVGLASYLLIGFWIERPSAAAAAKKAFITTRIGDMGFFLGILWLYHSSGTLLFYDHGSGCLESAGLIHAATMVAAGVFLVARVYPLFSLGAINGVTPSLTVVVWIGVTTALMAALIAIAQADIKRILAYSTVSQLGLMMVSLGVGGVAAGIMHLLAHGFFKALLFLGAGSVIHGCHHEQDIRKMGSLRRLMPVTFLTYAVGMMALSGVPLFFSGGWTKEEILHATAHWPKSQVPYYLILAGVILTALYMTRQIIYVFFGNPRAASEHAHESPRVMTMPLIALAFCAIFFTVVLTPAWPWLHTYLTGDPALHFDSGRLIQPVFFVSLVLVTAGIGLGVLMYRRAGLQNRHRPAKTDPLEYAQPTLFHFLENKMWLDELYDRTVVAFAVVSSRVSDWMDRYFWDGLVRAFGGLGQLLGIFTADLDERGISPGVDETTIVTRRIGRVVSGWHSGQIQTYLGAVAIGMLALLLLYAWLA